MNSARKSARKSARSLCYPVVDHVVDRIFPSDHNKMINEIVTYLLRKIVNYCIEVLTSRMEEFLLSWPWAGELGNLVLDFMNEERLVPTKTTGICTPKRVSNIDPPYYSRPSFDTPMPPPPRRSYELDTRVQQSVIRTVPTCTSSGSIIPAGIYKSVRMRT